MAEKKFLFDLLGTPVESAPVKTIYNVLKKRKQQRVLVLQNLKVQKRRKVPKVRNFFKTIKEYPDDIFYNHFRMSRSTFQKLNDRLKPLWPKKMGRPERSIAKHLYLTLWRLSNVESFRELNDRFDVGFGTSYRIFVKTIKMICKLKKDIIKFPSSELSQRKNVEDFENNRSHPFPDVLGAIDGTHISISKPIKDSISYYNRKGFYSVLLQGVVNSKFKFIDVFVGYPGSCHDAAMWRDSPLKKAITDGTIKFYSNYHLIGDAAYPLEVNLMVPYKDNGHLSDEQIKFNTILSSSRIYVEQAYGILKKKFRILKHLELQRLNLAKYIIMACIILHNIIIEYESCNTSEFNSDEDESGEEAEETTVEEINTANTAAAKRITLTQLLSA